MDSRENGRKTKTSKRIEPQSVGTLMEQDLDLDYQKLIESLHLSTQTTLDHLDKLIQCSNKRSNKRLYLELFRALVVDSAQASESLFFLFEYLTNLRASLLLLSMEIDKSNGKTIKEVKHLKTKVASLLSNPAVVEIGKILQNMQKIINEKRIRLDEKPVKEYLR